MNIKWTIYIIIYIHCGPFSEGEKVKSKKCCSHHRNKAIL